MQLFLLCVRLEVTKTSLFPHLSSVRAMKVRLSPLHLQRSVDACGAPTRPHYQDHIKSASSDAGGNQFGAAPSFKQSRCKALKLCAIAEDTGQAAPKAHSHPWVRIMPETLPTATRDTGISVLNTCIWQRLSHNWLWSSITPSPIFFLYLLFLPQVRPGSPRQQPHFNSQHNTKLLLAHKPPWLTPASSNRHRLQCWEK